MPRRSSRATTLSPPRMPTFAPRRGSATRSSQPVDASIFFSWEEGFPNQMTQRRASRCELSMAHRKRGGENGRRRAHPASAAHKRESGYPDGRARVRWNASWPGLRGCPMPQAPRERLAGGGGVGGSAQQRCRGVSARAAERSGRDVRSTIDVPPKCWLARSSYLACIVSKRRERGRPDSEPFSFGAGVQPAVSARAIVACHHAGMRTRHKTDGPATAPIRGRGSASFVDGRYQKQQVRLEDDGWEGLQALADEAEDSRLETVVTEEQARSVISRNQSPDVGFDQSVNPYRGCEHGCVYCFARPSHAYLDLSPGLDFETRLYAKTNAAERLRAELARRSYRCSPIALGI